MYRKNTEGDTNLRIAYEKKERREKKEHAHK